VKLGSTTQTQVALLVATSVVLAHILSGAIVWIVLRANHPGPVPAIGRGAATLLGELYDEGPDIRPSILEGAARAGLALRALSAQEAARCHELKRPLSPFEPHDARPRAKIAICVPALADGVQTAFRTLAGAWLGVVDSENQPSMLHHEPPSAPFGGRPPETVLGTLLLVTVATTVMLSVWISRGVTSPLTRLAEAADRIDVERGGTVPATGGTWEIRRLTNTFNRLIERLRAYAAEQRRLVAGVSHDLRTPLTRLRLRVEQVEDEALRDRLLHDLCAMQSVVESTLSLIRAQDAGVRKQDVDLGALLATIVDNLADAGSDVDFAGPQRLKLRCDAAQLTRAVENIIDNALKFAGRARVTLTEEPDRAVIDVRDDGPGIRDELKVRVFEPYFRGDESRGLTDGSGLGLSITKALVEAHGGTVALLDAVPQGLVVRVTLPKT
jgi:signal transduction histidine kinase